MFLNSSTDVSRSSKYLAFCSLHMLHIMHTMDILQSARIEQLIDLANNLTTLSPL